MLAADHPLYSDPKQKTATLGLYNLVQHLPNVSSREYIDPSLFSDPKRRFKNQAELLIQPDRFVLWMLYSQVFPYKNCCPKETLAPGFILIEQNRFLKMDKETGQLAERGR